MLSKKKIYTLIDQGRIHLYEWLPCISSITSYEDIEENLRKRHEQFESGKSAYFYIKYRKKYIGTVGFVSIDKKISKVKLVIGYFLNTKEGKIFLKREVCNQAIEILIKKVSH